MITTRQKVNSSQGNITDVINFELSQNCKKAMDDMRKLISDIQQEERSLLDQRTANLKITERNTRTVIVGGGVIGLIIAMFLALIISRNIVKAVAMLTLKLSNIAEEEATRQTQDSFIQINEQINDMVSKIESTSSKIGKVIEQVGHLNVSLQNVSAITEESATSAG